MQLTWKSTHPGTFLIRYIRFLYNRINLEKAEIRAASIHTLGKFALEFEEVREQIIYIMQSVLHDPDDETREKAFYFLTILREK